MKVKKEYVILLAVIIGLSAYLLTRQTDRTHYQLPQLAPIDGMAITRLEITGPKGTVELAKADDNWGVGPQKYRADKAKVSPMIDSISDLNLTALVSEAKDYPRYELDDKQKILVKAWGGSAVEREFDIGKPAPSFRHTFVRLAGDPNVYQASDNFRRKFDYSAEDLRDKIVLSFAASDISEITLSKGQDSFSLSRKEVPLEDSGDTGQSEDKKDENGTAEPLKGKMSWLTTDGRPVDTAAIDQLLATLSQLACDTYIPDKSKSEFSEPIYTIEVKGLQTYDLAVFDKQNDTDSFYPATSSQSTEPFYLTEASVKSLMATFEDFAEKPAEEGKSTEPDKTEPSDS